jgi:hypothetical protein
MSNPGKKSVYDESAACAFFQSIFAPPLRPAFFHCVSSIFFNFFFRQYRAALLPGRVPVSGVDHPLDQKIPFVPAWVTIYLDFIQFWVRMLSFLLRRYRRKAYGVVRDFILSMGGLYAFAAEVYQKNFSTTARPFYIARPRFFLIHLTDPHLMCIPSLHVMVVIRTWTKFEAIVRSLGDAEKLIPQIEEMKQGALAITRAILCVIQHSVNCVSAALYAMTCFDGELFPPEKAEAFAAMLFAKAPPPLYTGPRPANFRLRPAAAPKTALPPEDAAEIQAHIIALYRRFLAEREGSRNWTGPLLAFLRRQRQATDCPGAARPVR